MLSSRQGGHRAAPGSVTLTCSNPDVTQVGTFVVPSGVYKLTVLIIGGGGSGGPEQDSCVGGTGGGSGGWQTVVMDVVPFQQLSYSVGRRGGPGYYRPVGDYARRSGEASTFNGVTSGGGHCGFSRAHESSAGGPGGYPNGVSGAASQGGAGGTTPYGYGNASNGVAGCYQAPCGTGNASCPGSPGMIRVSW